MGRVFCLQRTAPRTLAKWLARGKSTLRTGGSKVVYFDFFGSMGEKKREVQMLKIGFLGVGLSDRELSKFLCRLIFRSNVPDSVFFPRACPNRFFPSYCVHHLLSFSEGTTSAGTVCTGPRPPMQTPNIPFFLLRNPHSHLAARGS